MKNNRTTVLAIWSITFAIYFLVRFAFDLGQPWEAIVKLFPEIVLLVAVFLNKEAILAADGGSAKKAFIPVIFALIFSMIGDTSGEMKVGKFSDIAFAGQILFFIFAHICYITSFFRHSDLRKKKSMKDRRFIAGLIIIFYLALVAGKVFAAIDSVVFMVACGLYLVALLGLGVMTTIQNRPEHWYYVIGAMFFIFSDSIIALGTFVKPVPYSGILIMSTYFVAQLLLIIPLIPRRAE